jgi:dTDP-4-dehydrorhamnose reductase
MARFPILLLGADGQLGRAIQSQPGTAGHILALNQEKLDLTDTDRLHAVVHEIGPQWVINAAAYTAVDQAESSPEIAFAVNRDAVASLAMAVREVGGRLLQLSTDYVFDGAQAVPYRPDDNPAPLSVYGQSKFEGERAAFDILEDRVLILRTSWLYSSQGKSFFTTMMQLLRDRPRVRVVCDQLGTPTHVAGLARAVLRAVELNLSGTLHWGDAGVASWYDFAVAIREEAVRLGKLPPTAADIEPIPSSEFKTPARRPVFSVLDKFETWTRLGFRPPHWRQTLLTCLAEMPDCAGHG